MVIVRLMGGLGNQMFQYAAARSLADRHRVELKLDIFDFEYHRLRRYELGNFQIRAEFASRDDVRSLGIDIKRLSLYGRLKRRFLPILSKSVFREETMAYDPKIESITLPVYLDGYWQSEQYFVFNKDAIQNDFRLVNQLDELNGEILAQIKATNAVSLHVRRSDYVSDSKTRKVLNLCSLDYYRSAVNYISESVREPHFFVFSDDHSWVQENLGFVVPRTFVTVNSSQNGVFDMMLMQNCKYHIIANSSFSWWGAWLNSAPDKIVIAPKKWFANDMQLHANDLIPSSWIKL